MSTSDPPSSPPPGGGKFSRRLRYRGTHPRRFTEKYKELQPDRYPGTVAKVIASGKTPAGQHRPIMVGEILQLLDPGPGERAADVTLGYGGHAEALLERLQPGGQLLALDADPGQLPRAEARLRALGYGDDALVVRRSNFAGLAALLPALGWEDGVDVMLADLGLSSMQIDDPARGFSYKHEGPLDMRMNPGRGISASEWLARRPASRLARDLEEGGDEPRAVIIAEALASAASRGQLGTTGQLRAAIESALPAWTKAEERERTVARVFQAVRVAVNEELSALDAFLARLPRCLRPGGRVALLSFHSGEDRRVKHHFRDGLRSGAYSAAAGEVLRPSPEEQGSNPRSASAKLRWAIRATESAGG